MAMLPVKLKMEQNIVYKERYGHEDVDVLYVKPPGQDGLVRIAPELGIRGTVSEIIVNFFKQIFLPHGYPYTVCDDYLDYQQWDTIQAFCSTITGTLATRAIMQGVGVGKNTATPLAATITWVLKDGTGMIGRIMFTWWKSTSLDSNCKQWRFAADILNDAAMTIELLVPYVSDYVTPMLCFSSVLKAVVGVAGGATRAAITQHQSIQNNMADVSAKDASQETLVNLFASITSVFLLSYIEASHVEWKIFIFLTMMHLYTNYKAVKSIKMKSLNVHRLLILLESYISRGLALSPETVNAREPAFLGCGLTDKLLCGFKIKLGGSLSSALSSMKSKPDLLKIVMSIQKKRPYLLVADTRNCCIHVLLRHDEMPQEVIKGYFHAVQLGIAVSYASKKPLAIFKTKQITSPLHRLRESMSTYMQGMKSLNAGPSKGLPVEAMISVEKLVDPDVNEFMGSLLTKGWETLSHQLNDGEWRGRW